MSSFETASLELGRRQLLAFGRSLGAVKIIMPILVPTLLWFFASWAFSYSVFSSFTDLRASYPQVYEIVYPQSEQQPSGQVEFFGAGKSVSVHAKVSRLTDYRARYIWLTAILTCFVFAIAATFVSGWIIWRSLKDRRNGLAIVIGLLALYLVARSIYGYNLLSEYNYGFPNPKFWNPVYPSFLDVLGMHLVLDPLKSLDPTFQRLAWRLHAGFLVLLGSVVTMLMVAAASTLVPPPRGVQTTPAFQAAQMRRGQIFLYTACTVMTVNVLYTAIWNRWPVELLPESGEFAPRIGRVRYGQCDGARCSSIASATWELSSLGPDPKRSGKKDCRRDLSHTFPRKGNRSRQIPLGLL